MRRFVVLVGQYQQIPKLSQFADDLFEPSPHGGFSAIEQHQKLVLAHDAQLDWGRTPDVLDRRCIRAWWDIEVIGRTDDEPIRRADCWGALACLAHGFEIDIHLSELRLSVPWGSQLQFGLQGFLLIDDGLDPSFFQIVIVLDFAPNREFGVFRDRSGDSLEDQIDFRSVVSRRCNDQGLDSRGAESLVVP